MYDSAARVQEIADLKPSSLKLNESPTVELIGKGNKTRIVPISQPVVQYLKNYLKENCIDSYESRSKPLFPNAKFNKLTRNAIYLMMKKYLLMAKGINPIFDINGLSCHSTRHSKATHLSEGGMPMLYISSILGHTYASTSAVYTKVNMKQKREAFAKASRNVTPQETPKWKTGLDIISFVKQL